MTKISRLGGKPNNIWLSTTMTQGQQSTMLVRSNAAYWPNKNSNFNLNNYLFENVEQCAMLAAGWCFRLKSGWRAFGSFVGSQWAVWFSIPTQHSYLNLNIFSGICKAVSMVNVQSNAVYQPKNFCQDYFSEKIYFWNSVQCWRLVDASVSSPVGGRL